MPSVLHGEHKGQKPKGGLMLWFLWCLEAVEASVAQLIAMELCIGF